MEGIASVWSYQESIDELKQRLMYTTFELESARMNIKEEMRKNELSVNQLLQLLKAASRERDEARDQLQRLLNKVMSSRQTEICTVFPKLQPESPPLKPKRVISSITEPDSLSGTYNHPSYGSSTVDSFFDTVSSPELSNMNIGDSSNMGVPHLSFILECNGPSSMGIISSGNGLVSMGTTSSGTTNVDQASSIIDNLVKGKPLPQKGKLLQAVMEAGPLLQTLLIAGPLPRWRNPPPLQTCQIPAVSIKGCGPEAINQKPVANPNYSCQSSLSSSYLEISSQIYSTSMLNFSSSSGSCFINGPQLSTGINGDFLHNHIRTGKRPRFQ